MNVPQMLRFFALVLLVPPAAAQDRFSDQVTCNRRDDRMSIRLAFRLTISGCQVHSECQFTMTSAPNEDERDAVGEPQAADVPRLEDADSVHVDLVYDLDLTRLTAASTDGPCDDRSIQALTVTPASLVTKRVFAIFDTTRVEGGKLRASSGDSMVTLADIPIFGEESIKLTVWLSPTKASELSNVINAARERCRRSKR